MYYAVVLLNILYLFTIWCSLKQCVFVVNSFCHCLSKASNSFVIQARPVMSQLFQPSGVLNWPNSSRKNNILQVKNESGLRCLHIFHQTASCSSEAPVCFEGLHQQIGTVACLMRLDQTVISISRVWSADTTVFVSFSVNVLESW